MCPTKTKRQEKSCLNIDPDNGSVGTNPSNHPEEEECDGKFYLCVSNFCYEQYGGRIYRYCRRIALGFADLIPGATGLLLAMSALSVGLVTSQ